MPSIRVYGSRIAADRQADIAAAMTDIMRSTLHVPIIEVFFPVIDGPYTNGKYGGDDYVTLIIEGPDYVPETGNQLCRDLTEAFRKCSGRENCKVSMVYHVNDHDHVGDGGVLLNFRKQGGRPSGT